MGCASSHGHCAVRIIVKKEKIPEYVAKILDIKSKYPDNCMA